VERETPFEFPAEPNVMDENTIIGSSDNQLHILDLRTNQLKSQPINSELAAQQIRAWAHTPSRHYLQVLSTTAKPTTQSSFSVSLYSLNDNNEAVLIWNRPIYHADAYQIIGDSIYLICPFQKSIDRYHLDTGELVESTRIPHDIVKLVQDSLTAKISVNDLPVAIMRVEELDGLARTRFRMLPDLDSLRLPGDGNVLFKINRNSSQIGYAHYTGRSLSEIGVFDLKAKKVIGRSMSRVK
jgi:hypothetical protein